MTDTEWVKQKLESALGEPEVPEVLLPDAMMETVHRKKEKRVFPLSKFLHRAAAAAAALLLFGTAVFYSLSKTEKPLPVCFSTGGVHFFSSEEEIVSEFSAGLPIYNFVYGKLWADEDGIKESANATGAANLGSTKFSAPENQAENVQEADGCLTDGDWLYTLNGHGKLFIFDVSDPTAPVLASELSLPDESYGGELFLDGNRLCAVSESYNNTLGGVCTTLQVFDISDRTAPDETARFSQEGGYYTSRIVGDNLYLISRKIPVFYDDYTKNPDRLLPHIAREGKTYESVSPTRICRIGETRNSVFTTLSAYSLKESRVTDTLSVMSNVNAVYCSESTLYLSSPEGAGSRITAISLNGGEFAIRAQTTVDGCPLNQFSMDEYRGDFRIAVTYDISDATDNAVYIFDSDLQPKGKLTGIAPDERVYSARFMGEKIYLVTFRETDPLFVIDASDPTAPFIAGEVQLPGYSSYLHPYGEHLLIGFGRHIADGDSRGGTKVSLFDVSDPQHPQELDRMIFEDAFSDALYDHKALLIDTSRSMIGFPLCVGGELPYAFAVVGIDENQRLTVVRRVNTENPVYRGIRIGDVLFTVTENALSADALFSEVHYTTLFF